MDALVVPTDPSEPVRVINLNAGNDQLKNLQREVGGLIDIVEYTECDLVINDEGRINGSHVRVTHFVLNDSTMAKVGRAWEGAVIYGDVVITGGPDLRVIRLRQSGDDRLLLIAGTVTQCGGGLGRAQRGVAPDHLGP